MFRAKTTRRVKHTAAAAAPVRTETPIETADSSFTTFFDAESASVSLTKPWLRLERGLRLQKFRAYADAYPGLNDAEKENMYKFLTRANDAKQLNTKQQIAYENGVIQSIRGLRIIRTGDPSVPAVFKIDAVRSTKRSAIPDDGSKAADIAKE